MKLYKSLFAVLAVAATSGAFVSCDDDLDRPPVIVPEATYKANTSIAEFKKLFWDAAVNNKPQTIPVNADGDSIILAGRVISSDQQGNVYQRIYVRDESGAMDFRIYGYDLYENYHMGQEVRINVTGLLVGGYGTQMQIGVWYTNPNTGTTSLGGMDKEEFIKRAQRNGLPSATDAEPYTVTLSDLNSWINDQDKLIAWQCQLVKLENMTFEGGGEQAWCNNPGTTATTNRTLKDAQGNTITIRTSDKCKFAADILPKGTGSVIGILSYYKGTGNPMWQLYVMNPATDCIDGFEFVDAPDGPSGDAIFSETFANGLGKFSVVNDVLPAAVPEVWKYDSHKYAIATAYVSSTRENHASDCWLVSPEIDLTSQSAAFLSFDQALNFFSNLETAKSETSVNIREVGTTEWTRLTVPAYPASMSWNFANSGDIDLAAYIGKKVEIGFRYTSTDAKAGTWEIKNVLIETTANHPVTPDTPDTPSTGIFSESFASGQGNFTIETVSMAEGLSYVWKYDETNKYMKASAFVGSAKASDSYLISPVIDLAGATAPVLTFEQIINKFPSVDVAKQQISVCAREEGASAWTKLEMSEFGSNDGWKWIGSGDISLSAFAGKKIQIAFHYTSTDEASGTWEVKNVAVK